MGILAFNCISQCWEHGVVNEELMHLKFYYCRWVVLICAHCLTKSKGVGGDLLMKRDPSGTKKVFCGRSCFACEMSYLSVLSVVLSSILYALCKGTKSWYSLLRCLAEFKSTLCPKVQKLSKINKICWFAPLGKSSWRGLQPHIISRIPILRVFEYEQCVRRCRVRGKAKGGRCSQLCDCFVRMASLCRIRVCILCRPPMPCHEIHLMHITA